MRDEVYYVKTYKATSLKLFSNEGFQEIYSNGSHLMERNNERETLFETNRRRFAIVRRKNVACYERFMIYEYSIWSVDSSDRRND